jgi:hypothetical protein
VGADSLPRRALVGDVVSAAVLTAKELRMRVARKFGPEKNPHATSIMTPERIVLFEVPLTGRVRPGYEHTGRRARQRIDVVAVGAKDADMLVHGFEVKVSRGDLLAELKDLSKSEHAVRACDRWWLVVAAGILRDGDPVPDSWGILEARGRGLTIRREPEPQEGDVRALMRGVTLRALVSPRYLRGIAWREGYETARRHYEGRRW